MASARVAPPLWSSRRLSRRGSWVARGAGSRGSRGGNGRVLLGSGAAFRSGERFRAAGVPERTSDDDWAAVGLPVFIHGTYDVFQLVATGECAYFSFVLPVIPLIASQCLRPSKDFEIEAAYPPRKNVDVHAWFMMDIHHHAAAACCVCCYWNLIFDGPRNRKPPGGEGVPYIWKNLHPKPSLTSHMQPRLLKAKRQKATKEAYCT